MQRTRQMAFLLLASAALLCAQGPENPEEALDEAGWEALMEGLRSQDPEAGAVCTTCGTDEPCFESLRDLAIDFFRDSPVGGVVGETVRVSILKFAEEDAETSPWTFHWFVDDLGRRMATCYGVGGHAVLTSKEHGFFSLYCLAVREEVDEAGNTKIVRALRSWSFTLRR